MDNIRIERTKPEDVFGITEVLKASWLVTYPSQEFGITKYDIESRFNNITEEDTKARKELYANTPDNVLFLSQFAENNLVGVLTARIREDGNGQIRALYVHPDYFGKKLGTMLMLKALDWLKNTPRIRVECASYNNRALNFYKKFGFQIDKEETKKVEPFRLENGKVIPEVVLIKNNTKFSFFEIVKIINTDDSELEKYIGKTGAVLGIAENKKYNFEYVISIYGIDESIAFLEKNLESTGKFDSKENFYDGSHIIVNTHGEIV